MGRKAEGIYKQGVTFLNKTPLTFTNHEPKLPFSKINSSKCSPNTHLPATQMDTHQALSPSPAPVSQPHQAFFLGRYSLVIPWSNSMKALAVEPPHLSALCQPNIKVGSPSLHDPHPPNLPRY